VTDTFGPAKRSSIMRQVRSRRTGPERALTAWLGEHSRYRMQLNRDDLPGKPDVTLPHPRVAIFVHGCFWHGHQCPRGARSPKTTRAYWLAKVARNRRRDRRDAKALRAMGWRVFTVWECRLRGPGAQGTLRRLLGRIRSGR
jgi:DNA mismatch endonuclease (patch repair protein)